MNAVHQNGDLQFKWYLLALEIEDNVATILLKEIVDLYVSIQGFAFASGCIEFYKQAQKKTLQKKKAFRKEIRSAE